MIDKLDGKQDGPACWVLQVCLNRVRNHNNLTGDGPTKCIDLFTKGDPFDNRLIVWFGYFCRGAYHLHPVRLPKPSKRYPLLATLLRCYRAHSEGNSWLDICLTRQHTAQDDGCYTANIFF